MNQIDWYTEETQDGNREIYYLKLKDGTVKNLSERIEDDIVDVHEIFNDDLIFLSLDEYTGHDYIAIYSIQKNKLIFPPIIEEFDTSDKSGFIYVQTGEDTMKSIDLFTHEVNPYNDFAYLYKSGDVFQNEGIIEEKYGSYYILSDSSSDQYMVYSHLFDEEDCIGHRDICDYYVEGENLCLDKSNGETIRLKLTNTTA